MLPVFYSIELTSGVSVCMCLCVSWVTGLSNTYGPCGWLDALWGPPRLNMGATGQALPLHALALQDLTKLCLI